MTDYTRISTAFKDGTPFLAYGAGIYHGIPFVACWHPSEFYIDRPWFALVGQHRVYEHVITHGMPLPEPPND